MPGRRAHILVAEDDIDDQELLQQALLAVNPGVDIIFITNGNTFRVHLEDLEDNSLPDLILLDYNLPEINGVEILKLLEVNNRYNGALQIPAYLKTDPCNLAR